MRGATEESINALPTHKFSGSDNAGDGISRGDQGGYIAAGTEKERAISGEDAVSWLLHLTSSVAMNNRMQVHLKLVSVTWFNVFLSE